MAFKLLIECSKDIDKLSIDFSDGTSVIQESPDKPDKPKIEKHQDIRKPTKNTSKSKSNPDKQKVQNNQDDLLDLGAYDDNPVQSDVVQKPVIEDRERGVKVAEELQNLDI
jgi:hypothetical protein